MSKFVEFYEIRCAVCNRSAKLIFGRVDEDFKDFQGKHWFCEKYPHSDPVLVANREAYQARMAADRAEEEKETAAKKDP